MVLPVEFTVKSRGLPKSRLQILMVLLSVTRKCQERPQISLLLNSSIILLASKIMNYTCQLMCSSQQTCLVILLSPCHFTDEKTEAQRVWTFLDLDNWGAKIKNWCLFPLCQAAFKKRFCFLQLPKGTRTQVLHILCFCFFDFFGFFIKDSGMNSPCIRAMLQRGYIWSQSL